MTDLSLKRLLLGSTLMVSFAATPAFAQDVPESMEQEADGVFEQTIDDEEREEFIEDVQSDDLGGDIVVTGSRLKKNTFNSISPLQSISTDFAAEQGLFNPVEILQGSTASAGQQIDSTFQGFVLDNGPGSETVDLRGLGAGRTLVTIDGRRLAPAGVEGAPSQPSINLVPITFIDDFDILLDGASSVYGSDAVAGVANLVLKRDFDGLEVDARLSMPEQSNGERYTLGASYGVNGERGFIGVQGEYLFQDNFAIGDRDFLSGCETFRERDENGNIRTVNIVDQYNASLIGLDAVASECRATSLRQRIFVDTLPVLGANTGFGSIYYQPEIANTGIGPFSETTLFGVPLDANQDGVRDASFVQFASNGQQQDVQDFQNQQERVAARVVGEYAFEGEMNVTPYFDVMWTHLETEASSSSASIGQDISADNPFNPCNLNAPGGVDCSAAYNNVLTSPEYTELFARSLNNIDANGFGTDNCFGFGADPALCNPTNFGLLLPTGFSFPVFPIFSVEGDRNRTETELDQVRILGGIKGDLPGLNFGSVGDFSFDIYGLHTFSEGDSSRPGIRDDRLNLAAGVNPLQPTNADGSVNFLPGGPCSLGGLPADVAAGCVPVNLLAPSLLNSSASGTFATQAEADYLFDDRIFSTDYEQTILDASIQGSLFNLPGGSVSAIVGGQLRWDDINSQPGDVARDGLLRGFFVDGGASGDRITKEVYGEVSIPLGNGKVGLRELTLDLAGRLTDDEFYGTNETYAIKGGWRPIDSLLLRGTYGTSFRAPTVRELFLANQSGFNNSFTDICAVPPEAIQTDINGNPTYDPASDPRTQIALDNCRQDGLDPTTFRGGNNTYGGVEIFRGGTFALEPEESTSFTVGASFDQPFTDAFDLELGVTYYEYDIDNSFVSPGAQFLVDVCYLTVPGLASPFCNQFERDANSQLVQSVDAQFINRDESTARGIDLSVDAGVSDVGIFGKLVDFGFTSRVNRNLEREETQSTADGDFITEELVGEFGFPKWQGIGTASASVGKFRLSWTSFFEGKVEADQGLDQFGNPELNTPEASNLIDTGNGDAVGNIFTTAGPAAGDVNALPISKADDYWRHNASVGFLYNEDVSLQVGVNNVFNKKPPLVDPSEVFSVNNVAIGSGYDYNGRTYTARLNVNF